MQNKPLSTVIKIPFVKTQQGFTLIETIVGIVVLSIAFSIFTTLIYPLANQSAEQVHQIRAAELGQSMLNEIFAKAFDENSDMSGGLKRCGEIGEQVCTASNKLGYETGETRATFDDVDDYNNLPNFENSRGIREQDYTGFTLRVAVINDSNYDGVFVDGVDNNYTAKLITVTVTTPQNFDFVFSVYRANF